jgi:hypothetical protein
MENSTLDNAVFVVSNPFETIPSHPSRRGKIVFVSGIYLHGPFGLAATPNGYLIVSNQDSVNFPSIRHLTTIPNATSSSLIEFSLPISPEPENEFVAELSLDTNASTLFGLQFSSFLSVLRFGAVNHLQNNVTLWVVKQP